MTKTGTPAETQTEKKKSGKSQAPKSGSSSAGDALQAEGTKSKVADAAQGSLATPSKVRGDEESASNAAGGEKAEVKADEKKVARRRKSSKREVPVAHAHVQSTFNNTIITITDPQGNVLGWSSAGKRGFKGARKSTPFAAQVAAEDAIRIASEFGVRTLSVFVNGPGAGRETALRGLQQANGPKVVYIRDVTPIPHNGCRPPKKRRV